MRMVVGPLADTNWASPWHDILHWSNKVQMLSDYAGLEMCLLWCTFAFGTVGALTVWWRRWRSLLRDYWDRWIVWCEGWWIRCSVALALSRASLPYAGSEIGRRHRAADVSWWENSHFRTKWLDRKPWFTGSMHCGSRKNLTHEDLKCSRFARAIVDPPGGSN